LIDRNRKRRTEMDNEFHVSFPGGKRVNATFNGMEIRTDQPVKEGGDGSAPEPYVLFLASIATCAGIYVKGFLDARGIPADGVKLVQRLEPDITGKLGKIVIDVVVPPDFPEKYHKPLARVVDLCAVKKTILNPPEFQVQTVVSE
jgi:putative redox protein